MKATWILPDGRQIEADVPKGRNMMEAAVAANVPGVVGECGGSLSCATCHVSVDQSFVAVTGRPESFDDSMLDVTEANRSPTSRLSCQKIMTDALDGLVLRVPAV